ncbi:MAG: flagellar biosynthesis protein FlhA [Calditrichaeota bacterium]|nr:MAG: flagellar biosynthesis protein FlhA [Calditrichota bacterium]
MQHRTDLLLALGVISILMFMVIPLPSFLLDILLAISITFSLMVLIVPLYVDKPLEFSVFPGILLIITLFRLSLNVASTRLILGEAYAGEVIAAFGNFVVKGNYVVGLVIFVILVIINFVVITKGSGRIAEVAARFTLDAMPGKQMAIDADLNAGLIDEATARARREEIRREADFYGAMDGASKFVRGDAVAGLLITAINILGGLIIGVLQMGMTVSDALSTYTILTVGDGLVSQIPALLVSTSAGIIVTRAASDGTFADTMTTQFLTKPRATYISGGVLLLMGMVPGLPTIPFFLLGGAAIGLGYLSQGVVEHLARQETSEEPAEEPAPAETIESYLHVDPLEIEIGYSLIPLIDVNQGGDLLDSITMIRKQLAQDLGIVVPPIRIRDNVQLNSNQYVIKIKGNMVATGEVMTGYYLALTPEGEDDELEGIKTKDPTYNLPACWLNKEQKEKAELKGYAVVDASAVVSTHLMEVLKNNAHKILDRQAVQSLLDNLKEEHSAVVEELVPNLTTVGTIQNVLRNLLKERVPIRDLPTILEAIADRAASTKDPDLLTEYVRMALMETISNMYKDEKGEITAMTLDANFEEYVMQQINAGKQLGQNLGLSPTAMNEIYKQASERIQELLAVGSKAILVTGPAVRRYIKRFFEPVFPDLVVLSLAELLPHIVINTVGSVGVTNYD